MAIYNGFSHEKWWFSIAMLNYQRVYPNDYSNDSPNSIAYWCLDVLSREWGNDPQ